MRIVPIKIRLVFVLATDCVATILVVKIIVRAKLTLVNAPVIANAIARIALKLDFCHKLVLDWPTFQQKNLPIIFISEG